MPKAVPEWKGDLQTLSSFKFNIVVFGKSYTSCKFVAYDAESGMLSVISGGKKTLCVPASQCEILITHCLETIDPSIEDVVTSDKGGKSKKRSRVAEEVIEDDDFGDDDFGDEVEDFEDIEDDDFEEEPPPPKKKKAPAKKRRRKS